MRTTLFSLAGPLVCGPFLYLIPDNVIPALYSQLSP